MSIKRVFIILMEDSNWSHWSSATTTARFVKNTLLPISSYATMYFNPTGNHPSLPNYLWLEAGTNFGLAADGAPALDHQSSTAHLVTQLEAAGKTWKSYAENINGATCPLTDSGLYVARHVPSLYFDDVTTTNSASSARCIAHVRPYTELMTDLQNNTVANYNFITPNLCDDGGGSSPPDVTCVRGLTDLVAMGDTFLSTAVPMITGSAAFADGGLLFVTWDEGDNSSSDGPIGFIAVGTNVKGGGYPSPVKFDHSSTLRSIQEIFGLSPLLGAAASSNDLADLFTSFP